MACKSCADAPHTWLKRAPIPIERRHAATVSANGFILNVFWYLKKEEQNLISDIWEKWGRHI